MEELITKLSNAHGISGSEENIQAILEEELKPYADEIRTDKMGNLIVVKKGDGPSIMLAAHMDEIGLMVKYIDDDGFLRFVTIGGWFDQTLHSQRVIVHTKNGPIPGVIGSKPPHVMKDEDRKKPIKSDDMFIDVGANDKEDAEKMGIEVGTPVSMDMEVKKLANGKITGKAFDNRAGCAIVIETMKQLAEQDIKATLYVVGTVQEEVGLKGARTSAYGLNPDVAIAIDTTIPGDHPGIDKKDSVLETGKGGVITVVDASGRGLIANPQVLKWLRETADRNDIPYQMDVGDGGTTDATAIHLTRDGIPTGVLSVATRYIHSPVEVLDVADLKYCADLLTKAIQNVNDYF
ncbi:M42 family metallopeptidase [Methanolobus zinderi]|uniref:M42 family metallopeptidase n=1 Tax=Methanolobus zinderi TaxID=536044 RepID=A0A7D5I4C2_9EURY|nr:M42 family metallopeptidase [Methanolobus zinderi]QLC49624.1 M42 family metallopeptidase [Methanolobus zinderi]